MSGKILVGSHDGVYIIRFVGDVRVTLAGAFDHYIERMLSDTNFNSVLIDLTDAVAIDSTSLGGLARLSISVHQRKQCIPTLTCGSQDILRVLHNMGFDDVFDIVDELFTPTQSMAELPASQELSEAQMRQRVIDAHRVLMAMNDSNKAAFSDLVKALEAEAKSALLEDETIVSKGAVQ